VFEATTRADMLVMHSHQKPILPSKRASVSISPALEAIIMSCLEKNPNKRPQSAGEVMELLRAIAFPTKWSDERASLWWKTHLTTHIQISDGPAPEKWMEPAG
jgi:eukaryotic-like serine/threonine-protein kinase